MHDLIRRAEAALTANPFSPQAGLIQDLLAALKAQQPAPVESEGLPPLPEPFAVHELWGQNVNVYSAEQLRRAQREAMAVERERWMKLCKDAAQRYFSGGFGEAAGACTHLHAQGSAIRQGASHD